MNQLKVFVKRVFFLHNTVIYVYMIVTSSRRQRSASGVDVTESRVGKYCLCVCCRVKVKFTRGNS